MDFGGEVEGWGVEGCHGAGFFVRVDGMMLLEKRKEMLKYL